MGQNFIENELVILSKQTIDLFLKQKNATDCIALYIFYYYTAKWQKTNQVKCTTAYAAKGLNKSMPWVRKTKKVLIGLGLIEDVQIRGDMNKISSWYVKINYIWKTETITARIEAKNHPIENQQCGEPYTVVDQETNA